MKNFLAALACTIALAFIIAAVWMPAYLWQCITTGGIMLVTAVIMAAMAEKADGDG